MCALPHRDGSVPAAITADLLPSGRLGAEGEAAVAVDEAGRAEGGGERRGARRLAVDRLQLQRADAALLVRDDERVGPQRGIDVGRERLERAATALDVGDDLAV